MSDYYNLFNLNYNYTKDELNNAYHNKLNEINNSNLSSIDKTFLLQQYNKHYNRASKDLLNKQYRELSLLNYNRRLFEFDPFFDNSLQYTKPFSHLENTISLLEETLSLEDSIFNRFKNIDNILRTSNDLLRENNIYSSTRSYNEKTLDDGSRLILETTKTNNNGNIEEKSVSFKKLKDGSTEPISYENAKNEFHSNKLQ